MVRTLIAIATLIPAVLLASDPAEYTEAVKLVQQQRWNDALAQLHLLAAKYPGNPKVLNLEGLALLGAGDTQGASRAFQNALAVSPDFEPALKNLAILEWNSGRRKDATEHTRAAVKQNPRDPVLNAFAAVIAVSDRDIALARTYLDAAGSAVSVLPSKFESEVALFLAQHGSYTQAESVFQDLIRRGYGTPVLRYNLALSQYLSGKLPNAIATLEHLCKDKPSADALNLLAQAYERDQQSQKAIDTLREAILLYPADENTYLDLANICLDHGSYEIGVQVVEVGLKYRPSSAKLRLELGLLHALLSNYEQAQSDFEAAGKLEPASDLPSAALQLASIQQSRLPDAIQSLKEQLKTKPKSALLWFLLGVAILRTGAAESSPAGVEAVSAFRNAMRYDPRMPYPYIELAKIYMRQKRFQEAVPLLEKAAAIQPEERSAYYQLAIAYRTLGQPDRANEMLNKVRQLMKDDRQRTVAQLSAQ